MNIYKYLKFCICFMLVTFMGCATSTRLKPDSIGPQDRIGVWSTYYRASLNDGVGGVMKRALSQSAKDRRKQTFSELRSIKTHKILEKQLLTKLALAKPANYQIIESTDIVVVDKNIDWISTAKALDLNKIVLISSHLILWEAYDPKVQFVWRPNFSGSLKMFRVVDNKILWKNSFRLYGINIPMFSSTRAAAIENSSQELIKSAVIKLTADL